MLTGLLAKPTALFTVRGQHVATAAKERLPQTGAAHNFPAKSRQEIIWNYKIRKWTLSWWSEQQMAAAPGLFVTRAAAKTCPDWRQWGDEPCCCSNPSPGKAVRWSEEKPKPKNPNKRNYYKKNGIWDDSELAHNDIYRLTFDTIFIYLLLCLNLLMTTCYCGSIDRPGHGEETSWGH